MAGAARTALRRFWQRSLRRIGRTGWAGLLLMAAGAAALALLPGLQREDEAARQRLDQRRLRAVLSPRPAPAPATETELAAQFIESFPPFSQNVADVRLLFESAVQAHVSLAKGDYTVQADAGSPFVAYVINLPLREPYPVVKQFAAAVLQALPHAALDEMRMNRADAGGPVLDTTLRFTLVYRPTPARPGT